MESIWQDLRFTLRGWRNRPAFAAIVVVTIALGIGATSSIFSVVNGIFLRPLPLKDPGRLVAPDVISSLGYEISLSIPNFKDWRERNRTFESLGANARRSKTWTGGDRPEIVMSRLILGDYFETLGVQPALGRTITEPETWAGAEPLVVVSHAFWTRSLESSPDALGRTLVLDAQPFTIVGVMPEDFVFPSADTDVFLPMGFFSDRMCWDVRGCSQGTWAFGRLKDGVSLEAAQADLERIAREISDEEGEEAAVARLQTLTEAYVGDLRAQVWILMGAVSFVLLIACANVAGLLLARGEGRRREIALRSALGAERRRLMRQLLTESLALALAAGVLGIGLARLLIGSLRPWILDNIPSAFAGKIGLDPTVLGFTFLVTLAAGLLFGIVPALRSARSDLAHELKEGARDTGGKARQRLRSILAGAEIALSLVLLIGAGLMIQSLNRLRQVDRGFRGENVLTARIHLPAVHYDEKQPTWQFYERLLERVQALPGTRSASLSNIVPLQGNSWERTIWAEGMPIEPSTESSVLFHIISEDHFRVLGIPILRGRAFDETDREEAERVAIIDDTMAERFWPGEDLIGKRVTFETVPDSDPEERLWRTVVGVARNVRHYELENPSRVQVYVPLAQSGESWSRSMHVLVQVDGEPRAMTESLRRELRAMNPDVPLAEVETMEGFVDRATSGTRVVGALLAAFSAVALGLAALGVFGVTSYSVIQRFREIGIRMALGAGAGDVVRMVARQGLAITLGGVVAGLVAALALTRLMASMLFQVEPVDAGTYGAFAGFLVGVSLLATWLPVRRAVRVNPAIVLREE